MSKRKAGRPNKVDPVKVTYWRRKNEASIAATARHFGISPRSVAKACAETAEAQRVYRADREEQTDRQQDEAISHLECKMAQLKAADERLEKAVAEKGRWSEEAVDASADLHFWANSLIPDDDREKMWR